MRKSKPRIYLDTSVISYQTARLHRDSLIRSRQLATRRWWKKFENAAHLCVSGYVLEEVEKGDSAAAFRRLELIADCDVLDSGKSVDRLAMRLLAGLRIPPRSRPDAFHLAIAAINGLDYILSWNFKHMVSPMIRRKYREICSEAGLSEPRILTPHDMLVQEAFL